MTNHLLLIPFHFPPVQGSTGAFRSLSFCKWLPENDWRVTVLTASPRAYPAISASNYELIDPGTTVHRAFALDAKQHFSIGGRYLRITALPDRWATWVIGGVLSGLRIMRHDKPQAIYTTYPVPSSHLIGLLLHKITGIPWIAEFRDPMVEEGYPKDGLERNARQYIQNRVVASAARVVTVTPSATSLYEELAGNRPGFVKQIANGYDDSLVDSIPRSDGHPEQSRDSTLEILHSGILYEDVRNPEKLFEAIQGLQADGFFAENPVRFVFRGAGYDDEYRKVARKLGIAAIVEFRESCSYARAHAELKHADALLLMQGKECNRQIPAKLYEYCALRKPVLSLADPAGDTGQLVAESGLGESVALENPTAIKHRIQSFVHEIRKGTASTVSPDILKTMSRRSRATELAELLLEVVAEEA